jgi:hypothetical protein
MLTSIEMKPRTRTIYFADTTLWIKAHKKAADENKSISAVIQDALKKYVEEKPELPELPLNIG